MSNTLGTIYKITSFGESHGKGVGIVIDGCPPNTKIDEKAIQDFLNLRKPGTSDIYTQRKEEDSFEILSGTFDGKSTGHPICILIRNKDQKPSDYDHLKDVYRPSHADFTYEKKYGLRDHRGGGRSSARITAGWVAAGAIANQILKDRYSIKIAAFVSQIHEVKLEIAPSLGEIESRYLNPVRTPNLAVAKAMERAIKEAKEDGDSLGGIIEVRIDNVAPGLGDPVFDKLHANLAKAMMSINATKGFEIGSGFGSVLKKGSELNDAFISGKEHPETATNHSGGVQGGISNGMPIQFRVAFKPTASIGKSQDTTTKDNVPTKLETNGRHDPCVLPRAVPIVEALSACVILDHLLLQKTNS